MEGPSPDRNFTMSEFIPRSSGETIDFSVVSVHKCETTSDEKRGRIVFDTVVMPGEHPMRFWVPLSEKRPQ